MVLSAQERSVYFSNYKKRKKKWGGTVLTLMSTTFNNPLHANLCFINNQILYHASRYGISLRYSQPQAGQGMLGNTEGSSMRPLPKEHALFWVKASEANWSNYYKIYHQLTNRDKWFWFTQASRHREINKQTLLGTRSWKAARIMSKEKWWSRGGNRKLSAAEVVFC